MEVENRLLEDNFALRTVFLFTSMSYSKWECTWADSSAGFKPTAQEPQFEEGVSDIQGAIPKECVWTLNRGPQAPDTNIK